MNTNPLVLNNGVPATEPLAGSASVATTAVFSYQQPSGTGGGNATGGIWNTIPLNTSEASQVWASIGSNQITLNAGTYFFDISSPSWSVDHYQTRLQNISNSTTALVGSSEYSASPASEAATNSFIKGLVTINSTTTFEVQLLPGATSSLYGMGLPSSTPSTNEVYCRVAITEYTSSITPGALSYAQAYTSGGAEWSTTSPFPTYADLALVAGTSDIAVRESSGIALTAAPSSLPGITFTPAPNAVYLITANFGGYNQTPTSGSNYQLTDGTTVIATNSGLAQGATSASVISPTILSGIYIPGTTSPVTVKIQAAASGGTAFITFEAGPAIEWTVLQLNNVAVMSNNGIVFAAGFSGSVSVTAATPILYDVVLGDNTNSYNPLTGIYTIPADGWYDISAQDSVSSGSTRDNYTIGLYKNGTQIANNVAALFVVPTIGSIQTPSINIKQPFKRGDQLQIQAYDQNGNTKTWGNGVTFDFFCVSSITTTSTDSNIVKSASTGSVFAFSGGPVQVLDPSGNPLTCSITTNGGDVEVGLQSDGSSGSSCVFSDTVGASSVQVYFYRDNILIATQQHSMQTNLTFDLMSIPASAFRYIDSPPAGNHVYTVWVAGGTNRGDQGIYTSLLYAKPSGGIGGGNGSGNSVYWSGYVANGAEWTATGTAFTDFTLSNGTPTLTQRAANALQVSAAAGNLPGISWIVPSSNTAYLVTATFDDEADGQFHEFQLTDGTNIVANGTRANSPGTFEQVTISGIYKPGSSGLITLKLQGASQPTGTASINTDNTGDATLVSAIEWSVVQLPSSGGPSAWTPYTPIFTGMGSVATQSFWYKYDGADSILIKGNFIPPTPDGSVASVSLPLGYTSNAAKMSPTVELCGDMTEASNNGVTFTVVMPSGTTALNFSYNSNTNGGLSVGEVGTTIFSGGNTYSFITGPIPIS